MSSEYQFARTNSSSVGSPPTEVTVTHQFHPLHGEKLEVVRVLRGKSSHLLVLRSAEGKSIQMRRDWTDYKDVRGDEERPLSSLLLDITCLREVVKIVKRLEEQHPHQK
jgi:hypothetical protein